MGLEYRKEASSLGQSGEAERIQERISPRGSVQKSDTRA